MSSTSATRNPYFDALRGVAILMVIAIHTTPADLSFTTAADSLFVCIRQLMNAAVPLFLALSAFFLSKKPLDTWSKRRSFWLKQIPKVYIPCLLWSLPLFVVSILRGASLATEITKLFVCGFSVYYFIALIAQYYLLLPWLQPFNNKTITISAITSVLSILIVSYTTAIAGKSLPLLLYAGASPLWIIFFVMGGWLAHNQRNYSLTLPSILCIAGLILSYFEAKYLHSFHGAGIGIKLSSFIYSAGVILLLFSRKSEQHLQSFHPAGKALAYIGRISFGIYLIHCHFIPIVRRWIAIDSWAVTWLLVALLSITAIAISRKLLPHKLQPYLGLK